MSHFRTNPPPLHSALLQVQLLQSQLKQEKLHDQVVYQFLKHQLSTPDSNSTLDGGQPS